MKYLIGFFLGVAVASAAAQVSTGGGGGIGMPYDAVLNAGVGPDGKMAPIRVDSEGHVICSKQ